MTPPVDTVARPTGDPRTPDQRRRFARRRWRRRLRWWRAALLVLVALGLAAGAVWAVYFSAALRISQVEVRGESQLGEQQVLDAAAVPTGEPLATADLVAVRLRVGSLALVRSVEVTRQWPDTVVVEVTERTPVAVVTLGTQRRGLDEDGTLLSVLPPGEGAGLPSVVSGRGASAAALAEAAHVVASLPEEVARRVDHVEVETVDRIRLSLRDGRVVQWGSAASSQEKGAVLAVLLDQPPAAEYDVSVPGLPTTRGSRD